VKMDGGRMLVFAREPSPGRVKTRLIPALGAEGAASLYQRLLEKTLAVASGLENVATELWYTCEREEPARCRELAQNHGASLHRQQGEDLGERMFNALAADPSSSHRPSVLIGSDCPAYSRTYLYRAFDVLKEKDAVLGPAVDGGYVLIGVQLAHRHLFDHVPWGSGDVLAQTRRRLDDLQWNWAELDPLRDVDRPGDLAHFPGLMVDGEFAPEGIES